MIPSQTLCEWTEQWRTPSGPHIAPPGGRTGPAGACGTSHYTGYLRGGHRREEIGHGNDKAHLSV